MQSLWQLNRCFFEKAFSLGNALHDEFGFCIYLAHFSLIPAEKHGTCSAPVTGDEYNYFLTTLNVYFKYNVTVSFRY